jgi:diguanylate cyclase (GGDEF)-like protein
MKESQLREYSSALEWFQQDFRQTFTSIVDESIPGFVQPEGLKSLMEQLAALYNTVHNVAATDWNDTVDLDGIPTYLWPLLKRVLLLWRRNETAKHERRKDNTVNSVVLDSFDVKIRELDELLDNPLLRAVEPIKMPMLLDYLPIQKIESLPQFNRPPIDRRYDEKFHILQAPDLFLSDLAYYRERCELRGSPLTVAFVDIDNFKALNTEFGHDAVDRYVLPFFMRCLESRVYNHGYAYRFGGDEYLVLMPNFGRDIGFAFLDQLRGTVSDICYQLAGKTTVSIGVCCVEDGCALTNKELKERAGRAMQYAKENGRNRLATYPTSSYRDEDLEIVGKTKRLAL